ncbi:muscarinic acetylcholine receptor M5-like [Mercenaria mercenaria]|uniref:muscarinic acetylcholine receptor M5-like n=1 Tax=Mercenaria mercenaria TaxID=6596 RepID=UPI00234ED46B|nr:muscarinic acetylcholine receptor M5-like [Mercenaria mercenaria]
MDNETCYTSRTDEGLFTNADFWTLWLSAIPFVIIFVLTVTANGAVIIMFAIKVKLRKCRNTYIMSLAVANFLIGITLPISILETLGEKWIFTEQVCTYFLTIRYSLYYVTILSIILITADRWWSVNFPFSYRIRRSKKMALSLAGVIWILSFVIHIPSIVGWNLLHVHTVKLHNYCRVPYEYNPGFTFSASVIEFFIPLILLISLNMGIYIKLAKRRNSKKIRRSLSTSEGHAIYGRKTSSDSDNNNMSDDKSDVFSSINVRREPRRNSSAVSAMVRLGGDKYGLSLVTARMFAAQRNSTVSRLSCEYAQLMASIQRKYSCSRPVSRTSVSKTKHHDDMVRDFLLRQDNKALLSLALLVITFVICWTPSILCDILYAFCPSKVPMWLIQMSYWILALSSSLNPFLYGIGSNDFRRLARYWFCDEKKQTRILENMLYNQFIQPCDLITKKGEIFENRRTISNNNVSYV